ncbi:MAG: stage III sporulation protein AB [Clostridiales bacterium]|jgi:stage III sporulation protein AB|nr:stage III sporulation protein AB [Clostridiales bacterium]
MIMKIIGSIVVCASSSLIGFYFANADGFRINELNEWKRALLILRSEIAFTRSPLAEAAETISTRVGKPVNAIFKELASSLSQRAGNDTFEIWESTISVKHKSSYLCREDWQCLKDFGKTLGNLDKSMQLSAIDQTISYIDLKTITVRVSDEKNKKLYGSLGILGGLLIVVILL